MPSRLSAPTCSILAGALLAASTGLSTATAAVSHRYVEIAVTYPAMIDVDENGVDDYHVTPIGLGNLSLSLSGLSPSNDFLVPFSAIGDEVGPASSGYPFYSNTLLLASGSFGGCWEWPCGEPYRLDPGTYLVGVEFIRDGATHYGWLGFDVLPDPSNPFWEISAGITEIAWESEPGTPIVAGWGDCDGNGLNDVVEILSGADLPDCNGDLIHDDCQPDADCNGNGVRDLCELGTPEVPDCNANLVPDSCEIAAEPALDCNGDGALDACMKGLIDCDGNGISDQCQSIPRSEDCDGNGQFDWCEIESDWTVDCDGDGVVDRCQSIPASEDCDGNGLFDGCEIFNAPTLDCDGDGVIDRCQSIPPSEDCDGDGLFDWCQLNGDPALDCDGDGVLDACAIAAGLVGDCDGDGTPDSCQEGPFPGNPGFLRLPGNGAGATIPSFCTVLPSTEITIELWQWIDAPGQAATFWNHLDESNRCLLHAPLTDGKVYWDFGSTVWPDGRLSYTPPEPIVGSWQHFSLQSSNVGDFMRIYRNGVLEAAKAGAEAFVPNDDSLKIGGTAWGSFNGRIDELRVWNHIRTAEQVRQFMFGTVDPATPGLVGYWRFDEGSGSLSEDLAGTHDALVGGLGEWVAPPNCLPSPDLDGDGIVDGSDLGLLLGAWGIALPGSAADLNVDGVVDGSDLGVLLAHWN